MSEDCRIYLWDAGRASGTSGSLEGAFKAAAPYLPGDDEVTVQEADVNLLPAGAGGSVSEHRRTGKAWRGTLRDGVPSWEREAGPEALAG